MNAVRVTCGVAAMLFLSFCAAFLMLPQQAAAQDMAPFADAPFGPRNDFEDLPTGAQIAIIVIAVLIGAVGLAIAVFVTYLLYAALNAVPQPYRVMEPGMVWLRLIPCFNLVWNFFVFTRIAKSYQNFFNSQGRTDVGDCGASIGIGYAICIVLISIPCLNYITGIFCGPAALILLILYLVKIYGLKQQLSLGKSSI